jgi:hypothetical protein
MKFKTPWKIYDESEMECHIPAGAQRLLIFVAKDRTCVWTRTIDAFGRPNFQFADIDRITELWERYRITALLAVAKVSDANRLGDDLLRPAEIGRTPTREGYRRPFASA